MVFRRKSRSSRPTVAPSSSNEKRRTKVKKGDGQRRQPSPQRKSSRGGRGTDRATPKAKTGNERQRVRSRTPEPRTRSRSRPRRDENKIDHYHPGLPEKVVALVPHEDTRDNVVVTDYTRKQIMQRTPVPPSNENADTGETKLNHMARSSPTKYEEDIRDPITAMMEEPWLSELTDYVLTKVGCSGAPHEGGDANKNEEDIVYSDSNPPDQGEPLLTSSFENRSLNAKSFENMRTSSYTEDIRHPVTVMMAESTPEWWMSEAKSWISMADEAPNEMNPKSNDNEAQKISTEGIRGISRVSSSPSPLSVGLQPYQHHQSSNVRHHYQQNRDGYNNEATSPDSLQRRQSTNGQDPKRRKQRNPKNEVTTANSKDRARAGTPVPPPASSFRRRDERVRSLSPVIHGAREVKSRRRSKSPFVVIKEGREEGRRQRSRSTNGRARDGKAKKRPQNRTGKRGQRKK